MLMSSVTEEWRAESVGTGGVEPQGVNGLTVDRLNELSCFTTAIVDRDTLQSVGKNLGKHDRHRNSAFAWKCFPLVHP